MDFEYICVKFHTNYDAFAEKFNTLQKYVATLWIINFDVPNNFNLLFWLADPKLLTHLF